MGVEQRHKFWLYPLVPNLFVFAAEAEKEGSKGGEEDNCRAFEATTPGNCDRQLWQNKNGQVYSHGIIVLANGSTSRALLGTTGLLLVLSSRGRSRKDSSASSWLGFSPGHFDGAEIRDCNTSSSVTPKSKRVWQASHLSCETFLCLMMVSHGIQCCFCVCLVNRCSSSFALVIVNHVVVYRKRDLWPGREMLRACAPIWEKRSIKVATRREKELE